MPRYLLIYSSNTGPLETVMLVPVVFGLERNSTAHEIHSTIWTFFLISLSAAQSHY